MARARNLKNVKETPKSDFTFKEKNNAVIRFNNACVVEIEINAKDQTVSGKVYDSLNDTVKSFNATLTNVAK